MVRHRPHLLGVFAVALITLLLLIPTASADDDMISATTVGSGAHSGSVDYGGDQHDWYRTWAVKGDVVTFNVNIQVTAWDGGAEARMELYTADGTGQGSLTIPDDGSNSDSLTATDTAQWFYIDIWAEDSWFDDDFDYTLSISVDTTSRDTDEDDIIDTQDDCYDEEGNSTEDRRGCPDSDGDGWSDVGDAFPSDKSQWSDFDHDTYGDNQAGTTPDHCPNFHGKSFVDRFGCRDSDGDGYSNPDPGGVESIAPWFSHPNGSADAFEDDHTQWNDTDSDGYGDNWANQTWNETRNGSLNNTVYGEWVMLATTPDYCPSIWGNSLLDRLGCVDSDGDGWSDPDENWTVEDGADAFPNNPSQWRDRDGDGWGDNQTVGASQVDDFPDIPTQWRDTDGDGWGDNQNPDAEIIDDFPLEPSQWRDTDGDGYGDNLTGIYGDGCPEIPGTSTADRLGCRDRDGDSYSDPDAEWPPHPNGFADAFPDEITQWHDTDGDDAGDNQSDGAFRPDSCPFTYGESSKDRWGCLDSDGDGTSNPVRDWPSHPVGKADAFPNEKTQWMDTDGDGYGDEPAGFEADDCVTQPGTSTNDRLGCKDTDGDGFSDLGDEFPHDPTQIIDSDGDGWGDNPNGNSPDACPDTRGGSLLDRLGCLDSDNDGYSDPDDYWLASPSGDADAFINNKMQWADTDGDGFGDNPLGSLRDDCPTVRGTSSKDLYGCPDENGDGFSNDFGNSKAALALLGSDPYHSWPIWIAGIGAILLATIVWRIIRRGG